MTDRVAGDLTGEHRGDRNFTGFGITLTAITLLISAPVLISSALAAPETLIQFAILFGVAIYLLPLTIGVCRGSDRVKKIFFVNLFTGWTIVGWILAMKWAIKSRPGQQQIDSGLRFGLIVSLLSTAPPAVALVFGDNSYTVAVGCGALAFQAALSAHWAGTNFYLCKKLNSTSESKSNVGGWDAFITGYLSTNLATLAFLLGDLAMLVAKAFTYFEANYTSNLHRAYFLGGCSIALLIVIFGYAAFVAWLNYRVARYFDHNTQTADWPVLRRLSIGLSFAFMLSFCALQSDGHSFNLNTMSIVQGLAIAFAYLRLSTILRRPQDPGVATNQLPAPNVA